MQEGYLKCTRYDHNEQLIERVCIEKDCSSPVCCCIKCLEEDHKNHEFQDICVIREWANIYQKRLNEIKECCLSFSDQCNQWQSKLMKMINQGNQNIELAEYPTQTQMETCVKYLRERTDKLELEKLLEAFNIQINQINQNMQKLQELTINFEQNKTLRLTQQYQCQFQYPQYSQQQINIASMFDFQNRLKEEKKALKTQNEKFEDEIENSRKKIQKLEHENSIQITQITNLKQKLEKKKEKSNQLNEKIKQTEQEKRKIEKELKEKNNQNQDLSYELEGLKQRLLSDQTQMAQITDLEQQQYKDKILDQQKQLTELQEQYDKLEQQNRKECDAYNNKLAELQEEVMEFKQKSELEESFSNKQLEEIDNLRKEICEWKGKIENKQSMLADYSQTIKEYQKIERLNQYKDKDINELQEQLNLQKKQFQQTLELFSKYRSNFDIYKFLQKLQQEWEYNEKQFQTRNK